MQNVYRNSWREQMDSCTGKLRTYSKFKKEFTLENYIIQFPLHIRRNLSKLRISAHSLAIETGRYIKNKSTQTQPIDKRLCFNCNKIESEFHLIFECTLYETERQKLFDLLKKITCIPFDATDYTFCQLMSCFNGDLEVGKEFCIFLNACFNIRTEAIKEIQEKKLLCRPESTITRLGRVSKRPLRMDL